MLLYVFLKALELYHNIMQLSQVRIMQFLQSKNKGEMDMKVYISADIEGITGVTSWSETEKGNSDYSIFMFYSLTLNQNYYFWLIEITWVLVVN